MGIEENSNPAVGVLPQHLRLAGSSGVIPCAFIIATVFRKFDGNKRAAIDLVVRTHSITL